MAHNGRLLGLLPVERTFPPNCFELKGGGVNCVSCNGARLLRKRFVIVIGIKSCCAVQEELFFHPFDSVGGGGGGNRDLCANRRKEAVEKLHANKQTGNLTSKRKGKFNDKNFHLLWCLRQVMQNLHKPG